MALDPNDPEFGKVAAEMASMFKRTADQQRDFSKDQVDNFKTTAEKLSDTAQKNIDRTAKSSKGSIEQWADSMIKSFNTVSDKNVAAFDHMAKQINGTMRQSQIDADAFIKRLQQMQEIHFRLLRTMSEPGVSRVVSGSTFRMDAENQFKFQSLKTQQSLSSLSQQQMQMQNAARVKSGFFGPVGRGMSSPVGVPMPPPITAMSPVPPINTLPPMNHGPASPKGHLPGVPPVPPSVWNEIFQVLKQSGNGMIHEITSGAGTVGEIGKIFGSRLGMPGMAAGAAGTILSLALNQASGAQAQSGAIFRSQGTNQKEFDNYTNMIPGLIMSSHQDQDKVIETANAFNKEGIAINSTTKNLQGYMNIAGQAQRLIGLSSETSAEFIKTMIDEGKTVNDVHDAFDQLWQTQQKYNLSIYDTQAAIGMGIKMFKEYGYITEKTSADMANSIMKTTAMYRSLGLSSEDATAAAKAGIGGSLSSVSNRTREAAMVAQLQGKQFGDVASSSTATPEAYQMDKLAAALKLAGRMSGDTLFMSDEDIKKSGMPGFQVANLKQRGLEQAASILNIDPAILQQALIGSKQSIEGSNSDYHKRAGGVDAALKKTQEQKKVTTDWDQAQTHLNEQLSETSKSIERIYQSLLLAIGLPALQIIQPVVSMFSKMLEISVNLGAAFQMNFGWLKKIYDLFDPVGNINNVLDMVLDLQHGKSIGEVLQAGFKKNQDKTNDAASGIAEGFNQANAPKHIADAALAAVLGAKKPPPSLAPAPAPVPEIIPAPAGSPETAPGRVPNGIPNETPLPPPPPVIAQPKHEPVVVNSPGTVTAIADYLKAKKQKATSIPGAQIAAPPPMTDMPLGVPGVIPGGVIGVPPPAISAADILSNRPHRLIAEVNRPQRLATAPPVSSTTSGVATQLAATARAVAEATKTTNYCATAVHKVLQKAGVGTFWGDGWDMGKNMAKSGKFDVLPFDMKNVQPGDIIARSWNDAVQKQHHGKNYGDISIALANKNGQVTIANDHIQTADADGGRYKDSFVLRVKQTQLLEQILKHHETLVAENKQSNNHLKNIQDTSHSAAHTAKKKAMDQKLASAGDPGAARSADALRKGRA